MTGPATTQPAASRRLQPPIDRFVDAMQGDREACLAAGMDDCVTKPIRVEAMVQALQRAPQRAGG